MNEVNKMKKAIVLSIITILIFSIIVSAEELDNVVIPEKTFVDKLRTGFKYERQKLSESISLLGLAKQDKAKLHIQHAELRVKEAAKLRELKRDVEAEKLEVKYANEINKVEKDIESFDEETKIDIQTRIENHLIKIRILLEKLPENGRKGVLNAIERGENHLERIQGKEEKRTSGTTKVELGDNVEVTSQLKDSIQNLQESLDKSETEVEIKILAEKEAGENSVSYFVEDGILTEQQKELVKQITIEQQKILDVSSSDNTFVNLKINSDVTVLDHTFIKTLEEQDSSITSRADVMVKNEVVGGDVIKSYSIYSIT